MKKLFLFTALVISTVWASSQDDKSKSILTELSTKAKTFTTVKAEFSKSYVKGKINESASGVIMVKGQKYYVETGEGQNLYCDGRTVYTHVLDSKEAIKCSLEEVKKESPIDPSTMWNIWEKDFKYRYVKEETTGGVTYDVIDLYPLKPQGKSFHTITLKIDRANKQVQQFIIKGTDSSVTTFTVKSFVTNSEIPDGKFIFVPSKYPGVEIIDC